MRLKSGQTIIEVLITLFIISVGLYGAMVLLISNMFLQRSNERNLVAMNLAREALEIVQNKRDSNWLANLAFDKGILDGADCTAITDWDGVNVPSFDFSANDLEHARLRKDISGGRVVLDHDTGDYIDYYRLLTFSAICQNESNTTDVQFSNNCACNSGYKIIGIRTKVDVGWKDSNNMKKITIYSDLYDWR